MNQLTRIHMQQDKNNSFISVGDMVRIKSKNGEIFEGEITCIDIKKEGNKLYSIIDIKGVTGSLAEVEGSFWVEILRN